MSSDDDSNNASGTQLPVLNDNNNNLRLEPLQNNGSQLEVLQHIIGDGISTNDYNRIMEVESQLSTQEQKRSYLIRLYDTVEQIPLSRETLNNISTVVRTTIVRNVKFVQDENTSGLSKEAIEKVRKFPSFWKPDLTKERSLQMDIFNEFPDLSNGTLYYKVQAWKGMREKVINSIRGHRNNTHTSIQNSIVSGKSISLNFFGKLNNII